MWKRRQTDSDWWVFFSPVGFGGEPISSRVIHTDPLLTLSSLTEPWCCADDAACLRDTGRHPGSPLWSLSRHQSPPEPPPVGRSSSSEDARPVCSDRELGREGEEKRKKSGARMKVFVKAVRNTLELDAAPPSSKDIPPNPKNFNLEGLLTFIWWHTGCCLAGKRELSPSQFVTLHAHIYSGVRVHTVRETTEEPTHPVSLRAMWVSGRRRFPCPRFLRATLMCVSDD